MFRHETGYHFQQHVQTKHLYLPHIAADAKITYVSFSVVQAVDMVKISALNSQQRLLQLAKSQLGGISSVSPVAQNDPAEQQGNFSDKHHHLAARSGAASSAALTLAQRAERRLQMQRERQFRKLDFHFWHSALSIHY